MVAGPVKLRCNSSINCRMTSLSTLLAGIAEPVPAKLYTNNASDAKATAAEDLPTDAHAHGLFLLGRLKCNGITRLLRSVRWPLRRRSVERDAMRVSAAYG
jgi:hypothetical protein